MIITPLALKWPRGRCNLITLRATSLSPGPAAAALIAMLEKAIGTAKNGNAYLGLERGSGISLMSNSVFRRAFEAAATSAFKRRSVLPSAFPSQS